MVAVPAASVIVPALNAASTLGATLAALRDQDTDVDYEVIVVDDGSEDDTPTIAENSDGVTLLRQARAGPAAARNRGVASAGGHLLAFTDADCVPTTTWLREGLAALEDSDLVQGAVRPDPRAELGPFDRTVWVAAEVGLYETANLFVRREAFDRVGGFEDWLGARLGKQLAEDVWLGWRLRRSGARTVFCERALVHHAVFARGPVAYVGERTRLVYFPIMVAKMPELREHFLFRRLFLTRRSAAFDLAVVAGIGAALAGSAWPLLAGAPYAVQIGRTARAAGRRGPLVAAAFPVADLVGLAALSIGSLRSRTVVL
jgi:glycosyltransferase involved in cell wall biosynthesis